MTSTSDDHYEGGLGQALRPPYFNGHDLDKDEALAFNLFFGQSPKGKNGRFQHEYLSGPEERAAIAALMRLLSFSDRWPLNRDLLSALICSLNPEGNALGRHLAFQPRKKKGRRAKRHSLAADYQVAFHVAMRVRNEGWPVEAAVADAKTRFGLSAKTVYAIRKRTKEKVKPRL
jgi:hypothetical protein